jgi:hypothetical protein
VILRKTGSFGSRQQAKLLDGVSRWSQPPKASEEEKTVSDLNIDLYGPPGSGKTVLLAALYKFVDRNAVTDLAASAKILEQYRKLENRQFTTPTLTTSTQPDGPGADPAAQRKDSDPDSGEWISFRQDGTNVRVISHRGESLLQGGSLNTIRVIEPFKANPSRILVAVLNPFVSDDRLAWKAVRNLIATLQKRLGVSFTRALYMAVDGLFHIEKDKLNLMSRTLATLVEQHGNDIVLLYEHDTPVLEQRFRWQGPQDEIGKSISDELERVVRMVVANTQPYRDAVRGATKELPNCLVVLTHIDLDDLMPSIDAPDFDYIFDELFNNKADRRVSQQLLAQMFRVNVDDQGITPWEFLEQSPRRFYRYIISLARPDAERLLDKPAQKIFAVIGISSLGTLLIASIFYPILLWGVLMVGATFGAGLSAVNQLVAKRITP